MLSTPNATDIYSLALSLVILFVLHQRLLRYYLRPNLLLQSSNNPPTNRSTTKGSTPRGVRIFPVYPQDENTETDVDIIAIHGFDTTPDSWLWRSKPGDLGVNWLCADGMLPSIATSARIFMCDWPSDLFEHSDYSQKTLDEFARPLLAGIEARPLAANSSKHKERPILFIVSCLGGILLVKALVIASPEYLSVRKAVRGFVFLATPFSGTSFRDVAEWILPGLKSWAFIRDRKVSNLLHETMLNSELVNLRRDFTALCREDIEPRCMAAFYETGKSSLPRKLIPWLPAFLAQEKPLVDEESATLDVIRNPLALNRTHLLMNKFPGPYDSDYNLVSGRIRIILERIREQRPLERADAYIKNTCYKPNNLKIERISGKPLPMERCYVNLVIIKHSAKKHQEIQDTPQTSQFSLHSRLNIKTPDKDMQVDMRHLFDQGNEEMNQHRRILIRGHAGVGKSTLCKKIVHDFKELDMWCKMFVRILWVPLRNLKRLDKANCNLEAVLREQYFSQIPEGKKFANELWKELEANKYKDTLFLLDGLDEVYEGLEEDNHMFNLLETLLSLPAVIVTSRPHVSLADRLELKFDLELETIGFYPDQVKSYIENVFTIPGEKEPDRRRIDGLQLLLQQHQLLQGLVRIPIQLDALCYIWSDDNSSLRDGSMLKTMTGIYQAIVERLWKKDILRLQKKDGEELITKTDIHDASLKMTEDNVRNELRFLERLAFTGMVSNAISFEKNDCIGIVASENLRIMPGKTLPRLSFLRTSDSLSRDPVYHFLHLTFQEYFAARYFVRQWEAKKPLLPGKGGLSEGVEAFLAHHKYDVRYNIFWRFVAGLLSIEGENIVGFFQRIGDEPLDLIGPVHQRLVMHCLSEVPLDKAAFSAEREKLESQLCRWLEFELNFMGDSRLAREIECPEAHLKNALESASMNKRLVLVESLRYRPAIPPWLIRLASSWLQDSYYDELNIAILNMFDKHECALDNEIIGDIIARLAYEKSEFTGVAIRILSRWSSIITDILDVVVKWAVDKNDPTLLEAIDALEEQPQLDDKVIDALVAQLQDREPTCEDTWWTKEAIIPILARQPRRREEIHHVIAAQLEREDCHLLKIEAAQTLLNQPDISDNILRKITTWLISVDKSSRWMLINKRPKNGNKILGFFRAQLKDQDCHVRWVAIEMLGRWPQLSHDMLKSIKERAQDEDEDFFVRVQATEVLVGRQQLDDDVHDMITAWLQDEKIHIRYAILDALREGPQPSKEIVDMVVARLKEDPCDIREKALLTLTNWSHLSDTVLEVIALRLSDSEEKVQKAAAEVLGNRLHLNDNITKIIVARLKGLSQDKFEYIRAELLQPLLRALRNCPHLDDSVLYAVAELKEPSEMIGAAIDIFRTRPQPKDHIISAIMGHLENYNEYFRRKVLEVVGGWHQLSDKFLVTIAARLGDRDWDVQRAAFYALTNQSFLPLAVLEPHMKLLYKYCLRSSFSENVYWLTENGKFCMVVGARKFYWEKTGDDAVRKSEAESNSSGDHARQLHYRLRRTEGPDGFSYYRRYVALQLPECWSSLWCLFLLLFWAICCNFCPSMRNDEAPSLGMGQREYP